MYSYVCYSYVFVRSSYVSEVFMILYSFRHVDLLTDELQELLEGNLKEPRDYMLAKKILNALLSTSRFTDTPEFGAGGSSHCLTLFHKQKEKKFQCEILLHFAKKEKET